MGNTMEAEEVLQESFIKVFEKLKQWKGDGPLGGWIRTIVVNTSLTRIKNNKKFRLDKNIDEAVSLSDNGEDQLEALQAADLMKLIAQMPDGYKTVFNLFVVEGYGHKEWVDQYFPSNPYSASKAAAEIVFSSYSRSFFADTKSTYVASARAGNVIGGGDWSEGRVISDCVRAIEKNTSVEIRNPNSTRPWQHVLEPLSGYLTLAIKLYKMGIDNFESWNFGPNTNDIYSVEEVVNLFHSKIGKGTISINNENIGHEAGLLQLNCD
jgi:CDP-glucose 4,6-dehydratase